MKTILTVIVLALVTLGTAFAQAPEDLSFLTNRATLASWSLKQVDTIEVQLYQSAAGSPDFGIVQSKSIPYSGQPSLSALAKSLKGTALEAKTPIPSSLSSVYISLKNYLPDGKQQELFGGGVSGLAEYNGTNWVLPKDASEPTMYMSYFVFIPAQGIVRAWMVDTNQWGWAVKKSLQVWEGEGFYFEGTLAGQAYLCLEFLGDGKGGGNGPQYVYDLRGNGRRAPLPSVIAKVSIRDSEDVRDFGDNATLLTHWVYTYKPDYSTLTYGKVPLLVANYTNTTTATLWVGSAVGAASEFSVTRMADKGSAETKFNITVPAGSISVDFKFEPGLYHIVPLGIDVCPDWWEIQDVHGNGYPVGKG